MRTTLQALCRPHLLWAALLLLLIPSLCPAQPEPEPGLPPISQELVREGDFAVKLLAALGLGTEQDETEAESGLGQVGIIPRNGWIADYPVTPDIMGELQLTVGDAAAGGKIALGKGEALQRLAGVAAEVSLGVRPQTAVGTEEIQEQPAAQDYPNPTVINDYYQTEGPPVVTYYAPPPDYYYLYGWIPYPFWCAGFWFPGYFILHDFHRSFHAHNRVSFVSNHFNDLRSHRVFRVDPVARFNGRTFAGIGVRNRRGFLSTGVPRSQRAIFNAPRAQAAPGMRPLTGMRSGFRSGGGLGPAQRATGRGPTPRVRGTGSTATLPTRSSNPGRTFSAPTRGAAAGSSRYAPIAGGAGRSVSAPTTGGAGRGAGAPSAGHGGGGFQRR
jgi:hypothetical protein